MASGILHRSLWLAGISAAAAGISAFGNVTPAKIFSDNMVLQSGRPVAVWGKADPGEAVTVRFAGQTVAAKADAQGNWEAKLAPLAVEKKGGDLVLQGKNTVTLRNVVVGDVWLCSGQSNMEMTFGWRVLDNENEKADSAKYPLIRHIKVQKIRTNAQQDDIRADRWKVCSPQNLNGVTATGYFFAKKIHQALGIPVGIIDDNWSGCRIEPFTAPEGFAQVSELKNLHNQVQDRNPATENGRKAYQKALEAYKKWIAEAEKDVAAGRMPQERPALPSLEQAGWACGQYNAMIAPIVRFPIKGALWYQGCSNGSERDSYFHKTKALVQGWRKAWGYDFPFYFVQLASFQQPTPNPAGGNGWSHLREAQRRSLTIPGTGMAVTIDIGDARDIHPKNKQDVGDRLARWALVKTYGVKNLPYSGPLYKSMKVEGNKIRIAFDHTDNGLMVGQKDGLKPTAKAANGKLAQFAVAGADKKWFWADAAIDGDTVVVSSPDVKSPVAVRYAFSQNPVGCNLYNGAGLPASPFRTDNW